MNIHNGFAITRFTWLEIRRARIWLLALALVVVGSAAAEFGAAIAITESAAYRMILYAAAMRPAAVFVIALFVAASVLREIDDKGVEVILSRPVSRADWYLGRFAGYTTAAIGLALLAALPLLLQAPAHAVAWCFSLALELTIVVSATLAATITLRQIPAALCFIAGFYLLARGMAGLVLIAGGPSVDTGLWSHRLTAALIDALAYVLPDLDRFTHADWLTGVLPAPSEFGFIVLQSLIYTGLLLAVGLFDAYRRDF